MRASSAGKQNTRQSAALAPEARRGEAVYARGLLPRPALSHVPPAAVQLSRRQRPCGCSATRAAAGHVNDTRFCPDLGTLTRRLCFARTSPTACQS